FPNQVEPSTRFELVTPSLPRTCSTPELRGQSTVAGLPGCQVARGNRGTWKLGNFSWSGRRDSNPRPTAWKAVTLPTELLPPFLSTQHFNSALVSMVESGG